MRGQGAARAALRLLAAAVAAAGAVAGPGAQVARAAGAPAAVDLVGCAAIDARELRRILGVELRGEPDPPARLSVRCAGDRAAALVERPGRGAVAAEVDLGASAAIARTRTLALALAELARAPQAQPQAQPQPQPQPVPPRPDAPIAPPAARVAAPAPAAPRPPLQADALLAARLLFSGTGALVGGGARVGLPAGRAVAELDLVVETAQRAHPAAFVRTTLATGGAALLVGHALGPLELRAGAGARLGLGRLAGTPRDQELRPAATVGPCGGPFAAVAARLRGPAGISGEVRLEGGALVAAIRGNVADLDSLTLGGPYLALGLAVGFGR